MDFIEDEELEFLMLVVIIILIEAYQQLYVRKSPCMTSEFIGDKWIGELLVGHPTRFHNMFRMSQVIFTDLCEELQMFHGLHGSKRTTVREVLGITLYILSHNESIRATAGNFQQSIETISRYFALGLEALVSLLRSLI